MPLAVPPFGFTRHPLRLLGYGLGIAHAAWRLGLLARQERLDLIHANSVRAGLIACAAAPWHRRPVICHVRDVLPPRAADRPPRDRPRWTLIAGGDNRCFLPSSQERTFAWLDALEPGRHALHVLPGFTHLDLFFGARAEAEVFDHAVAALTRETSS